MRSTFPGRFARERFKRETSLFSMQSTSRRTIHDPSPPPLPRDLGASSREMKARSDKRHDKIYVEAYVD